MPEKFRKETFEYSTQPAPIEVLSLAEFSGQTLEVITRRAVESRIKDKPSDGWMDHYRRKFEIPDGVSYEDGIAAYAERKIREYEQGIEAMIERAKAQIDHSQRLAIKLGYIEAPRPVRMVVVEPFLNRGVEARLDANRYDVASSTVFIQLNAENHTIAHEVGHVLSHVPGTQRSGFYVFEGLDENGCEIYGGNQFLNEGATVLWERVSTSDDSKSEEYDEELSLYGWYRDTTKRIIQEIGMTQDEMFRAYFGNPEMRQKFEQKILDRFGCTYEELNCLSFSIRHEDTEAILSGREFEVAVHDKMHESVVKTREELARIFPNVKIKYKKL